MDSLRWKGSRHRVGGVIPDYAQNPKLTGEQTAQACEIAWFRQLTNGLLAQAAIYCAAVWKTR